MVYCATFVCSANRSNNRVTHSWFKFSESTLFKKKANFKPTKHSRLCSLRENLFRLRSGPEKVAALGHPGAKISLKEDVVPTLFPAVEAMLMPPIRRTQAATRRRRPQSTSYRSEMLASCQRDTGDVGPR